jgi:N-acetylglucosamine malate deacetylase 1
MNVLVIAPHPDDEAIGCGGAICKHVEGGDQVIVAFLTSGELGLKHLEQGAAWKIREAEAQAAANVLGLSEICFLRQPDWTLGDAVDPAAEALTEVFESLQPGMVYVPHPAEWHPDHKAAVAILQKTLANNGHATPEIRGYEVWTPLADYHIAIDITEVLPRKIAAIRCHKSQCVDIDYAQAARGLAAYRGAIATRTAHAEVFQRFD